MILDHNEGIRTDDVLERHYTDDDRLDDKQPLMARGFAGADEQAEAVAATLPAAEVLVTEMARRRGSASSPARQADQAGATECGEDSKPEEALAA